MCLRLIFRKLAPLVTRGNVSPYCHGRLRELARGTRSSGVMYGGPQFGPRQSTCVRLNISEYITVPGCAPTRRLRYLRESQGVSCAGSIIQNTFGLAVPLARLLCASQWEVMRTCQREIGNPALWLSQCAMSSDEASIPGLQS